MNRAAAFYAVAVTATLLSVCKTETFGLAQPPPVGAVSPETYAKTRAALDSVRSLHCTFPRGGYVDLADPKLARHENAGAEVTFDAIDRKAGRARIVTKTGAGDVSVITGPTALTF